MDQLQVVKKPFPSNLVAAGIAAIHAIRQLIYICSGTLKPTFWNCGMAIAWLLFSVGFFRKKKGWLLLIPSLFISTYRMWTTIRVILKIGISNIRFDFILHNFIPLTYFLPYIILLMLILFSDKKLVKGLCWIPMAIEISGVLLLVWEEFTLSITHDWGVWVACGRNFLFFLFAPLWLAYPDGLPKREKGEEIIQPDSIKLSNVEVPKMKFCSHCGKEIMDAAVVCPHCGCAVGQINNVPDVPSTGLNVVAFLLPLVGLILYLVHHDKAPKKAAAIGKWALIGFGACVALYVLNIILLL